MSTSEIQPYQIVLSGKGNSGRGVRYRILEAPEVDAVDLAGIGMVGPEATGIELRMMQISVGARAFLVEYSEHDGHKDAAAAAADKWLKADPSVIAEKWSSIFNAKDTSTLRAIYRTLHVTSQEDIDAIMGKAVPVSTSS